jgi:hypothetical protein
MVSEIRKGAINRFLFFGSALINLSAFFLVLGKLMILPEPIILKYNAFLGVSLEGDKREALVLPFLGLAVFLIDWFLVLSLGKDNKIALRILLSNSFLFNLIILIAVFSLVLVNGI